MRRSRVAAVVLAAGASRRLGEPKQLLRFGGETLLERAVRVAAEGGCEPVFVVLGAGAAEILSGCGWGESGPLLPQTITHPLAMRLPKDGAPGFVVSEGEGDSEAPGSLVVLRNPAWEEGMGSSVRVGVGAALKAGAEAVVMLTCDQPAVTAGHVRLLVRKGVAEGVVVGSGYAGRCGVPAYFPGTRLRELLDSRGDAGARGLLDRSSCLELELGELDVDTPAALKEARRVFGA